jgi:cytoplasmic iron level regulating protein YaaA (DUF328/UPF0246 family)
MIIVLSPSKSMDMEPSGQSDSTEPLFLDRSEVLVRKLRGFSVNKLKDFMEISEKLAELNRRRFAEWHTPFTTDNARQALLAFTGDVYDGLDAASLKKSDFRFAQKHLRILSGLYGLLRPLDLIQPYRLEMGRPLKTQHAGNLYEFWSDVITEALNAEQGDLLVNLASQEYARAIDRNKLARDVVSPVFKDEKNGRYRIISFYAKRARGAMARYLIENRVSDREGILGFDREGYRYNAALSQPSAPAFTRPAQ